MPVNTALPLLAASRSPMRPPQPSRRLRGRCLPDRLLVVVREELRRLAAARWRVLRPWGQRLDQRPDVGDDRRRGRLSNSVSSSSSGCSAKSGAVLAASRLTSARSAARRRGAPARPAAAAGRPGCRAPAARSGRAPGCASACSRPTRPGRWPAPCCDDRCRRTGTRTPAPCSRAPSAPPPRRARPGSARTARPRAADRGRRADAVAGSWRRGCVAVS